ncbi:hypothetical protein CHS0354_006882 [Potamilus streckersoni]|uniref:Amidohydrolase-related domain-containing protein n=1 Tax=Potamilus streckersoni TaxID=2493646 RepID=A0AAE0TEE0_9BIVA|nr:hypothetical protein CHS0354_006882 [Potamilus streckersoni]
MFKEKPITASVLSQRIDQAAGRSKADLVVKNVHLFNLATGETSLTDIAVCGDTIVGTYSAYSGTREIDGRGLTAVPGFIDTHLHIESSLVTPGEFERGVLPRGTTTAICDPHEICNVLGKTGLEYFLASAEEMFLCTCYTHGNRRSHTECSGFTRLYQTSQSYRIGGVHEFSRRHSQRPGLHEKLVLFSAEHIDGHSPLLNGLSLNAYLSAGISTDHESTEYEEAREKLAKGMHILIREGSITKDLRALAPLLSDTHSPFMSFCTDDRNPVEINREGHIDFMTRKAVSLGVNPLSAYRAASWSAAKAFGLRRKGLLAPGYTADIVLLEDITECRVKQVICQGKPVAEALFASRKLPPPPGLTSVMMKEVVPSDFDIPVSSSDVPVIGIIPHKVITRNERCTIPVINGCGQPDPTQDIMKICVLKGTAKTEASDAAFAGDLASGKGHWLHQSDTIATTSAQSEPITKTWHSRLTACVKYRADMWLYRTGRYWANLLCRSPG